MKIELIDQKMGHLMILSFDCFYSHNLSLIIFVIFTF